MASRAASAILNVIVLVVTIVAGLVGGEIFFRETDGYRLDQLGLVIKEGKRQETSQDSRDFAARTIIDPSFQLAWYDTDPADYDRSPKGTLPEDWIEAVRTYKPLPNEPAFVAEELKLLYNSNWLKEACATGNHANVIRHYKLFPGFVYSYPAPDDTNYPEYRIAPRGWDRGKDYYNNFGFRGPDVVPARSARTIRIAFLGASTTANGWPFTYPEFVVHYLRAWAKANGLDVDFDVINAGRGGTTLQSARRVFQYEVAPLHPDIVVHYEGANEYHASSVLPNSTQSEGPKNLRPFMDIKWLPLEQSSALANRVYELLFRRGGPGAEPDKPPHQLTFDLNQQDPNLDDPSLPFRLHGQVDDFRAMEQTAKSIGADLVLTSFVTLVQDGMRLDPERNRIILRGLNEEYFPMTYKEIRAGADFENRVFRKVATVDGLHFLDVARYFPQDPDFFADMVHFNGEGGFRLQGWIVAQLLAPMIKEAVLAGKLPKPAYTPDPASLAWVNDPPVKFDLSCLPPGPLR